MARKLSEMQQKFLAVLFQEAAGDVTKAKQMAGYSPNVATSQVVQPLSKEIEEETRRFLSGKSAKAAWAMSEVMDNPVALGNKEKMQAAKDIMDRAGLQKVEKVEVESRSPVFFLPAKNEE